MESLADFKERHTEDERWNILVKLMHDIQNEVILHKSEIDNLYREIDMLKLTTGRFNELRVGEKKMSDTIKQKEDK